MSAEEEAAIAVGRAVLEQVSPDEVDDFDAVARHQLGLTEPGHGGVGISLDAIADNLIDLLLPIVQEAIKALAAKLLALGVDKAERWLSEILRRGHPSPGDRIPLTADQIHDLAHEIAAKYGLKDDAARALGDTLAQRLTRPA